jgi:lipopolysaccharide/colanic/teichoic acid biosynthesis glycosyltransferase
MKLTSHGPVFYSQTRVGTGGREFALLKFRTMVADAEADTGPVLSGPSDDRITGLGRALRRFKIDEIPQFWNVLRGDMSVVGPRPERMCFVEQFSESIPGYAARHQMRPGITGLAQIYGGYTTDAEIKIKYDLLYVYGGSLLTDLKVLVLTIPAMIKGT